jgi:hypothetical protein
MLNGKWTGLENNKGSIQIVVGIIFGKGIQEHNFSETLETV